MLAVLCLVYYGVIRLATGRWNSTFARVWPVAGILLLAFSYLEWRGRLPHVMMLAILAICVLIILTCIPILYTMFVKENDACDYLIILGAHVNGRVPSDSLERRIRKAEQYLKSHPMTKVIVSGGQGKGEDITEAEAMEIYLWEHGIEKERILKETASTTTRENLRFSKALFTPEIVTVGIVTNNFHLFRALLIGRSEGYENLTGIAAGCNRILFLNYMVREFFAVVWLWIYNLF